MSSSALALFRPQGGGSNQIVALGVNAVYGVSKPSFAMLAQQLLFRILFSILERVYRFVEGIVVSKFDSFMSRFSPEKTEPESKILKELAKQNSLSQQAPPLSAAIADDVERLSLKEHPKVELPLAPTRPTAPKFGPPAFRQSWWDLPPSGPPSWIVRVWEKRGA